MNLHAIPQISPDLICRVLEDGAVVVEPRSGAVTALNEMGATVWGLIDGRLCLNDLAEAVAGRYVVGVEQAARDLEPFLADLARRGLVTWKVAA